MGLCANVADELTGRRWRLMMSDRRWMRCTAVIVAVLVPAGCVADRLPDLDRLGATRSATGEAAIVVHPCGGESIERIMVQRSDGNFETRGDVIWEIESKSRVDGPVTVTIGETPDGFDAVTPLTEDLHDDDPLLLRVTTDDEGVIPMSLRLEQLKEQEVLTRQDTYQTPSDFEKTAAAACR